MKTRYIFLLIFSSLFIYNNCYKSCDDKLTALNNKVPYKNGEIITFKNDTLGERHDTLFLYLDDLSSRQYYPPDDNIDGDVGQCIGQSVVCYSNSFAISIVQGSSKWQYPIYIFGYQGGYSSDQWNSPHPDAWHIFDKEDEIEVEYDDNGQIITAYKLSYGIDTFNSERWKYEVLHLKDSSYIYNDFYYTKDKEIKLLQYTTVYPDGKRRIWKLKE